jgi:hypothetical protein
MAEGAKRKRFRFLRRPNFSKNKLKLLNPSRNAYAQVDLEF